jgi:hypothetical protein
MIGRSGARFPSTEPSALAHLAPHEPLTLLPVVTSLVELLSGFVHADGFPTAQPFPGWTALFLATTVATSATGLILFPRHQLLPSHQVGINSMATLAVTIRFRVPAAAA